MSYIYCNWWCNIRTFLYGKVHSLELTLCVVHFIGFDQYMACTPLACVCRFCSVQLFETPWTVDLQTLLPWDSLGKNTEVACHALLQAIFLTQGLNLCLLVAPTLHQILYCWATGDYGEGNGTPLQYSCLENPMDGGAWWAAVHGWQRVGHNWAPSLSLFSFMHWRRKWQPTPVFFLPGEPQGRGAWWTAICGVTQSWTRLKWLGSSSPGDYSTDTVYLKSSSTYLLFQIENNIKHLKIQ